MNVKNQSVNGWSDDKELETMPGVVETSGVCTYRLQLLESKIAFHICSTEPRSALSWGKLSRLRGKSIAEPSMVCFNITSVCDGWRFCREKQRISRISYSLLYKQICAKWRPVFWLPLRNSINSLTGKWKTLCPHTTSAQDPSKKSSVFYRGPNHHTPHLQPTVCPRASTGARRLYTLCRTRRIPHSRLHNLLAANE